MVDAGQCRLSLRAHNAVMSKETETTAIDAEAAEPKTSEKPYDREAKLKEILEQDEKNPHADPFMGF